MKRAERRHHRFRLIKSRKYYHGGAYRLSNRFGRELFTPEEIQQKAVVYARTPQLCSCVMCGNKRRYQGRSMQEKKHDWE